MNNRPGRIRMFCSKECAKIGQKSGQVTNCLTCGVEFYSTKAEKQKFCSSKCFHVSTRGRQENLFMCRRCGNEFTGEKRNRIFCSKECQSEVRRQYKKCTHCGKRFRARRDKRKFCTLKCSHASKTQQKKNCQECHKLFSPRSSTTIFCSNPCRSKSVKLFKSPQYQIGLILQEAAKIKTSLLAAKGEPA